ncbi:MAG: heparan-alpha-glucosaminide N-acetyltransferase [Hoeflea sp.]|nr:heparan-alpha-glucosaminide N-acetyltransferase [Hoeflea sp.]
MSEAAGTDLPRLQAGWRIEALDLARGLALFAMASYHFSWNLEQFGYLEPATTTQGLFRLYARSIAGSFLFLAGVSLMLAHGPGLRRQAFLKRFAMVGGAAALITVVTIFATPGSFIYFGILHAIAAASVVGLAFLRLPGVITILAGAACLVLPQFYRDEFFNPVWLNWIGLFTVPPRSNDFVPLMPWLGPFLIGMGCTRIAMRTGLTVRLAGVGTGSNAVSRAARFSGRHSLAFYLVHQPVLLALIWIASQVAPPAQVDPLPGFIAECETGCSADNSAEFCTRFCGCVTDELLSQELLTLFLAGEIDPAQDQRISAIAEQCTALAAEP